MLVLLSPAKSLDWSPPALELPVTAPDLGKDARVLVGVMKRKRPSAIAKLMSLSEPLAQLNHERFQAMTGEPDGERDRPAAFAFDGDVYKGLDARTLSAEELTWAQDHVAILSGLYGVLRPLDLIEQYRLEMGTRLKTRRGASLYAFWGDRVQKAVEARLAGEEEPVVVNLASQEYSRVVQLRKLGARVVTPVFQEISGGDYKTISFFAKRARGMMARFVVQERMEDVAGLRDFDAGGYRYRKGRSTEDSWVFARKKPPPMGKA